MSLQVYNNWSEYLSNRAAGVSLILSDNSVMYDGANVVKKRPQIGDFVVAINGHKRFITANRATATLLAALPVVGKVYDVQGKLVRIVSGVNTHSEQWSNVCDYLLVPDSSLFDGGAHSLDVTLQDTLVGKMNYIITEDIPASDSLRDFSEQLNTWLAENAPKWECYYRNDEVVLQMSTYDGYESTCSITSCTLTKRVGSELAAETVSDARNENGQDFAYYQAMCKPRELEYFPTHGSSPATAISDIQANAAPVTEAYFNGELGVNLRTKFGTYEHYIDMCMVHLRELNRGVMQFRDGKAMCDKLLVKTVLKRGVEECPYSAAVYANNYAPTFGGSVITGFEAGKWWLPSMYELGLLMRNINSAHTDPVSLNMNLVSGWSYINNTSNRWSVCRFNTNRAWFCDSLGIVYISSFCFSFAVSAVSAFEIED